MRMMNNTTRLNGIISKFSSYYHETSNKNILYENKKGNKGLIIGGNVIALYFAHL